MTATATSIQEAGVQQPDLFLSFQSIPELFSTNKRPTVTLVPIWANKVCLVRPRSAGAEQWWVFPQEGVLRGDGTFMKAALRGLYEELGLTELDVIPHRMKALCGFENPIPPERRANGGMTKVHYVIAIPIANPRNIMPNKDEISGIAWVQSVDVFDAMTKVIAEKRPVKQAGMCAAIGSARQRKLINWSH